MNLCGYVFVQPLAGSLQRLWRRASNTRDCGHWRSGAWQAPAFCGLSTPLASNKCAAQSDGKSSLLEAFLGFRFNVREVEMGTRRPLIVQMVHDPSAEAPRCRLQEESSEEYGWVAATLSAGCVNYLEESCV